MRQECDGCFSNESYWLHQMIASKQCYFSIRQSNETIVAFGWREWAKKKYKEATISSNVPAAKQTSNIRNEKAASHFCEWMKRRYLWFMEYISNWSSSPQTHTHTVWVKCCVFALCCCGVESAYGLLFGFWLWYDVCMNYSFWHFIAKYHKCRIHWLTMPPIHKMLSLCRAMDVEWLMCSCKDNMKCKFVVDDCDRTHVTKLNHLLRLFCSPSCVNWLCGASRDAAFMCVRVRFHLNDMHP